MSKIRLTERQLNTLISESVKRILREDEQMDYDPMSDTMDYSDDMEDIPEYDFEDESEYGYDDIDNTISEAIHRVTRYQMRNRRRY